MKIIKLLALLMVTLLLAMGCGDPTESVTDPVVDPIVVEGPKITFEDDQFDAADYYAADVTREDTGVVLVQSTEQFSDGVSSIKATGVLQDDSYSDPVGSTLEMAFAVKLADILEVETIDFTSKIVSVDFFVPADSTNAQAQVILQIDGDQAMSSGVEITAGEWTTLYFKIFEVGDALNTKDTPQLCNVDATGTTILSGGAYTGGNFDSTVVTKMEIRTIGATIGADAVIYVDSIDWE